MNALKQLATAGQSPWLDFVSRKLVESGEIATLIDRDGLKGMTSNPAIFEKSIAHTEDYDVALRDMITDRDYSVTELYEHLAIADIQAAADALYSVYQDSAKVDGYISLEVSPYLAHDEAATISEARRLWRQVSRANLMVKVPATAEGIAAISSLISEGINVNVTLLFALEAYEQVAEAYIAGLEARAALGKNVDGIASVASFFVSRIDNEVDRLLDQAADRGSDQNLIGSLKGQIAIANAKRAYCSYETIVASDRWKKLSEAGAMPQRLLWASTSSKNPAYSDTLYIERLIGRDTVNTIPPNTMDAFRDHGEVVPNAVSEDLDGARGQLQALADLGISLRAITEKLLQEGVGLFSDAFDRLLGAVARKRLSVIEVGRSRYLFSPGSLKPAMADLMEEWRAKGNVRRLWAGDASLWTSADESQWLGWLGIVANEQDQPGKWRDLAADVAEMRITDVVLLGMGGSSLGPEVINLVFGDRPGPRFHMLDSSDPAQVSALDAQIVDYAHTIFIVSSKSGSTLEPNVFLAFFYAKVLFALGDDDVGQHFIAVTDPGSGMEARARKLKFWHVFFGEPSIGGRYSVLSPFGLTPMAALGIDTARFLVITQIMVRSCAEDVPPEENHAVQLGLAMGIAARQGRDKLTILTTAGLSGFGAWVEQLVAESTGKNGTGIIPIDGEPLGTLADYGNDRFFLFYSLGGEKDEAQETLKQQLEEAGHPVASIIVDDAFHLGQEFFRLEIATATAGAVLGIDPFNQPDVEASKIKTRELTDAFEKTGKMPEEAPIFSENGVSVFADAANAAEFVGANSLRDYLSKHFDRVHPSDYLAFLAYIQRTPASTEALNKLRAAVLSRRRVASCLGFGPRFLHSTGQAYKGGPASGVFLQITVRDAKDVKIPGRKFGFSVMKAAQAQGDLGVLYERGRRALRVHLNDLGPAWEHFIATALDVI